MINEGVTLFAIGSELEGQHFLVAKFLASCGVNNLPNDPIVTEGVCFRALAQKETGLLDKVLENVSNPHEFIELALCQQDSAAADKLLIQSKKRNQKIRNTDPFNFTAGFWAAANQLDFGIEEEKEVKADLKKIDKACPTLEDWKLTLRQLSVTGKLKEFTQVYPQAVAHFPVIAGILDEPMLLVDKKDEKMDESIQQAFHAAASANHEYFEKTPLTTKISYALSIQAYRRKNYAAMKTILDHCDKQELLKMLLIHEEKQCSLFLLIGAGFNLLQLSFAWRQENSLFKKFSSLCWKNEGNFKEFMQPFAEYKSMLEWEKTISINYLEQKVERLSKFTSQLNQAIDAKCCLQDRFSSPIACTPLGKILFGIYSALMVAGLIDLVLGLTEVCPNHCSGYSPYYPGECVQYSNDCILSGALGIAGLTFFNFLFGCIFGIYTCITPFFKRGRERFHEFPINHYDPAVQAAATALFDDFKEMQTNPFANRNLDSKVAHVLPGAERLLTEKQAELQQWRVVSDHRVQMIPEVKEQKVEPVSGDDEIPELWIRSSQFFSLHAEQQSDQNPHSRLLELGRGTL